MDIVNPASTTIVTPEIKQILTDWQTDLLANASVALGLYQNVITVDKNTTLADLQDCDFGNYALKIISAWSGPYLDPNGQAYSLSALEVFTCDGTVGNAVQGSYLVKKNGTTSTATNAGSAGGYAAAFTITAGGTGYEVVPKVHLTGADGTGATAHAVVIDGVVTDIVLDTAGSGYTSFTVVVDPPYTLVQVSPFANPAVMNESTDALATVCELRIPSITNN